MFRKRVYGYVGLSARLQICKTLKGMVKPYASLHGDLGTNYRCEHGHVESIRVVEVETVGVCKCDFFRGMVFVETILVNDRHMIKQFPSSIDGIPVTESRYLAPIPGTSRFV